MKILIFFLLVVPLPGRPGEEEPTTMARNQIRAFLEETETKYFSEDTEKLPEAATRFRALQEQAPEGELSLDALKLAEGMAYLKAQQPEKSVDVFGQIEGFEDPELRGQLRQMKGNAHLQLAEAAVTREEWEPAKKEMDAAIESFKNTLRESPEKEAARHNLEFAYRRLAEIKEMEPPPPPEQDDQKEEEEDEQDQDQQDQNSPQNQDQQKKEDQEPQDPSDSQPESSQQEPESENGQSPEDADPTEESPENSEEKKNGSDQDSRPQDSPSSPENASAGDADPTEEEKLDAMQMQQILDSALEQEKRVRRLIQQQQIKSVPVEKDW